MYSRLNQRCDKDVEEMAQLKTENDRLANQNEALQIRFSELIGFRNDLARLDPVSIAVRI